jgi:hypothetical protein
LQEHAGIFFSSMGLHGHQTAFTRETFMFPQRGTMLEHAMPVKRPQRIFSSTARNIDADEQVKNTFLSTTQLIPSVAYENEAFPKQQHTARFPFLAARRLKETVCCDPACLNKNDGEKLKQWGMLF